MYPIAAAVATNLILDRYLVADTGPILIFYSLSLCCTGDFERGRQYGKLAVYVATELHPDNLSQKIKTVHLYSTLIHHWFESVKTCEPLIRQVFRTGQENGDIAYAGYTYVYMYFITANN
jgi:DNA polymerase/3'-5' exonuclease PolX